jgi:AraC family transcriptional regulator
MDKLSDFTPTETGGSTMDVSIKKLEPKRVAFMRHIGPYDQCGETWEKFMAYMGAKGYLGPEAMMLGLCHDDPEVTPPDKIRYDACLTVDEDFRPEGEIGVQTIAGGEYAVTTHYGPYAELGETYAKLYGQWMPHHGYMPRSAPCFEVYLNDPEATEPEELLTDIYAPIEPK